MKIHQLRFFAEVCNRGSITKAAEALHVTQPAVSQAIIELEREYGVKLFHRTNNGLKLTRDGSFMLLDVREILEKTDLLAQKMNYLGRNKHVIRVGMPPMIAISNFNLINEFKQLHPYIVFDLFHESSPLLRRKMSEGALDLCMATGNNNDLYRCETKKLTSLEVCLCVSPNHELAKEKCVSWEQIIQQKLVIYKDHYQIGQAISQHLNQYIQPDTEILESNNTSVHINLVTKYMYCGFVYKDMAEKQPGVVGIPLEDPIYVDLDLICQVNSSKNRDILRFINFIKAAYDVE